MSNSEIAKIGQRQPAEVQPSNAATLPSVVENIMAGVKTALDGMSPDDLSIELSASTEKDRSHARFSLRAYKHRNGRTEKIVDEEHDV